MAVYGDVGTGEPTKNSAAVTTILATLIIE